jgi:hypothetical protein
MASQNTWKLLGPMKFGADALLSGEVSIPEALQSAKRFGLLDNLGTVQPNPLTMANGTPSGPMDMNAGASPAPTANTQAALNAADAFAKVKNAFTKNEKDTSTRRVNTMNRMLTKAPEQLRAEMLMAQGKYPKVTGYQPALDEAGMPIPGVTDESRPIYDFQQVEEDPENPVVQQKQGLTDMQELLKLQLGEAMKKNRMDFTPLAALADAVNAGAGNRTNLAASAVKPEDDAGAVMTGIGEIQKRRSDLQKAIGENIRNMKGGSALDQLIQMQAQKEIAGSGAPGGGMQARVEQSQWNRAHIAHQQLMTNLQKDTVSRQTLQGFNTLANSLAMITNTKELTAQQLMEAQRKIMQAMSLSGGGTTLGDERAQMYLKDIGQDAERVVQYFSGVPMKLSQNDPIIQHIRNMAMIEQENLHEQRNNLIDAIVPGYSWIYEGQWPDLNRSLEAGIKAQKGLTSKPGATFTGTIDDQGNVIRGGKKPAKKAGGLPSLSEIDAELARRKGGK